MLGQIRIREESWDSRGNISGTFNLVQLFVYLPPLLSRIHFLRLCKFREVAYDRLADALQLLECDNLIRWKLAALPLRVKIFEALHRQIFHRLVERIDAGLR